MPINNLNCRKIRYVVIELSHWHLSFLKKIFHTTALPPLHNTDAVQWVFLLYTLFHIRRAHSILAYLLLRLYILIYSFSVFYYELKHFYSITSVTNFQLHYCNPSVRKTPLHALSPYMFMYIKPCHTHCFVQYQLRSLCSIACLTVLELQLSVLLGAGSPSVTMITTLLRFE